MCYSNREEQKRWKCIIQIQRNSTLEVCYSNREEQKRWKCVIQIQMNSTLEVSYSNREEQKRWKRVIQIQSNRNAGSLLFKYRVTTMVEMCYLGRATEVPFHDQ